MVAKFVVLIFASLLLQDAVSSEQVPSGIPRAQDGAVVAKNNGNSADQPMDWGKIWNWNFEKGSPANSEPKLKAPIKNDFPINNRAASDAKGNPSKLARYNNAPGSNFIKSLPQKIRKPELDPRYSLTNRKLVNLRNQFNNKADRKYDSEEYNNFDESDDEDESYDSLMSESSQMYEDDLSSENNMYNKDYEFPSRIGQENQRYPRRSSMSRPGPAVASPSSFPAINYPTQVEQPVMQTRSLQMRGVQNYGKSFDSVSM